MVHVKIIFIKCRFYLEISVEGIEEDLGGEKVLHHADEHAALPVGDPVKVVLGGNDQETVAMRKIA